MSNEYCQFKRACRRYLKLLGLGEWRVTIQQKGLNETDAQARVYINWVGQIATIAWNTDCQAGMCAQDHEATALHEVLHIAMHALIETAASQKSSDGPEVQAAEHALINRLVMAITKEAIQ